MIGEGGKGEAAAPPPPAPPQPVTYQLGLNPALWEIIDAQKHLARCIKHKATLVRREGPRKDGKGKWVRYDCPSGDASGNLAGYCKTSGWPDEIFGDAP